MRTVGVRPGPLDGLVVADFSRVLAGPLTTVALADLGADVIKVERPGAGDDTRAWGPPWTADSSAYFACANRGKRSVELDLSDPQDLVLAKELAARADVVVENFKTGGLDRRGLGYDDVARTNPGVVYCSITGFGSGRGAELPGYDFLVQAVGGLMSITGEADGQPTKVGVALVDILTSKDAVIGVLAALRARELDGHGQRVEVNLLSSIIASLANQASSFLVNGTAPARMGNAHPSIAPYELLACADGSLAVACGNDDQFRRMATVLGQPDLALDTRFATNADRVLNRSQLVQALEKCLIERPVQYWMAALTAADVPAGRVGDIGDAFAMATGLGLDPRVPVGAEHPDQVRNPVRLSRSGIGKYTPPPRLGEHSEEIREWLGRMHPA